MNLTVLCCPVSHDSFICDVTLLYVTWIVHMVCLFLRIQYSLLHLECHVISISNLNLLGLFSTERGKRDLENKIIHWDSRFKKWHSKCSRLYHYSSIAFGLYHMPRSCVIWRIHLWHTSFMFDTTHWYVTRLIHMCRDSFIWGTWPILSSWLIEYLYEAYHVVWYDSVIRITTHLYVSWLIHMRDMTHIEFVTHWYDSVIRDTTHSYVSWLIHMRDVTHTWPILSSWLIDIEFVTQWYVTRLNPMCRDSFIWDMARSYVMQHIHTWSHFHTWHDSFRWYFGTRGFNTNPAPSPALYHIRMSHVIREKAMSRMESYCVEPSELMELHHLPCITEVCYETFI